VIAQAFIAACKAELDAPKPGNVHVFADGHRMTVADFICSAEVAAEPLCEPKASVGRRILDAVTATREAVGSNTNLGIILLCAPLARAAEAAGPLLPTLQHVLADLSRDDADLAFRAISLASPAGLGSAAAHDVLAPADCTLREAMAAAADRDRIARAYVTDFDDIFSRGLAAFAAARQEGGPGWWPATAVYLGFLAAFPDSHIARKLGTETAIAVRDEARGFLQDLPEPNLERLLAFDAWLKARNINPGTSADLTVATLFAASLSNVLRETPDSD
jgi:triphosphoribosyl-dephospho-CoA synthase